MQHSDQNLSSKKRAFFILKKIPSEYKEEDHFLRLKTQEILYTPIISKENKGLFSLVQIHVNLPW